MQPSARKAPVYWLAAAQHHLVNDLAEALAAGGRAPFHAHVRQVNARLQQTFDDADAIVVRARFSGYRPDPSRDVLLVEVVRPCEEHEAVGVAETHIVKVAVDPEEGEPIPEGRGRGLDEEWEGWRRCWPRGVPGDAILTMLREGARDGARLLTLRYQDAHAMLGAADLVPLETAFLDCCQYGTPTVESLAQTLTRLYVQLEQRFYQRSFVGRGPELFQVQGQAPPLGTGAPHSLYLRHRLHEDWLPEWCDHLEPDAAPAGEPGALRDADRRRFRREALAALAGRRDDFLDPCDYLRGVLAHPERTPDLLRGCAHGDLHGRNALVGLADGEAVALALFDYEHLRPDNLVGWDFVKLETELKVRAYPRLFPGTLARLAPSVHDFEKALIVATEQLHDHDAPLATEPEGFPGDGPGRRLARLLLTIRQQARRSLGLRRHRAREWLEEYYFLATCYGVYAGRFETYRQQELVSAYVAAGTAARRLSWPWRGLPTACASARQQATAALGSPPGNAYAAFRQTNPTDAVGHVSALEFLRCWVRAGVDGQRAHVQAAADELGRLRVEFPHALEVEEELVLALLELGDYAGADRLLSAMSTRYTRLSEEGLCRFGSRYKRSVLEGEVPADGRLSDEHRTALRRALEYYQRAYALRRNYYPGINVAALLYLLGETEKAAQTAAEVFAGAAPQPGDSADDAVWKLATQAEAHLWRRNAEEARRLYRRAAMHRDCQPQYRESMRRQLRLALLFAPAELRGDWSEEHLRELFDVAGQDGLAGGGQSGIQANPI